jgi:hypothetical protein
MVWTRQQTQEWITQLEHRVEDIDYYLKRTVEWCENNGVWSDDHVFLLSFMTVIWVSHMRLEPISKKEIFELLGIAQWENTEDFEYSLSPEVQQMDFEEMLEHLVTKF